MPIQRREPWNHTWAQDFNALAQRWHDTDHGRARGRPKRRPFADPRPDDFDPLAVPDSFRTCKLCDVAVSGSAAAHANPYWYRVIAWESGTAAEV